MQGPHEQQAGSVGKASRCWPWHTHSTNDSDIRAAEPSGDVRLALADSDDCLADGRGSKLCRHGGININHLISTERLAFGLPQSRDRFHIEYNRRRRNRATEEA